MLLLLLSPGFIAEMADFLHIPADFGLLLDGVPLPDGDALSQLLQALTYAHPAGKTAVVKELYMEVVGQMLRLLRWRYQALCNLSGYKENTVQGSELSAGVSLTLIDSYTIPIPGFYLDPPGEGWKYLRRHGENHPRIVEWDKMTAVALMEQRRIRAG